MKVDKVSWLFKTFENIFTLLELALIRDCRWILGIWERGGEGDMAVWKGDIRTREVAYPKTQLNLSRRILGFVARTGFRFDVRSTRQNTTWALAMPSWTITELSPSFSLSLYIHINAYGCRCRKPAVAWNLFLSGQDSLSQKSK